ncbi:hypothetical protein RZE82_08655 [Mollicutes bacterium LVI A0039]|nr:hypothetical protein RZE82_08655 [Mollicutes bacterium LVI A0039]
MNNCIKLFKNLDEQCIIVTSSYGTQFFLQLLSNIDQEKISKIYVLDGLETIDKASLEQIAQNRVDRFDCKDDYLNYYLDEVDKQDDFKVRLIDSVFISAEDAYQHILDNETFIDYLLNIDICPIAVIKTIKNEMTIYSSIDLDYPHVKITEQEHLVMLERSDIMDVIQAEIKQLIN